MCGVEKLGRRACLAKLLFPNWFQNKIFFSNFDKHKTDLGTYNLNFFKLRQAGT